jgi:hypothetical protein
MPSENQLTSGSKALKAGQLHRKIKYMYYCVIILSKLLIKMFLTFLLRLMKNIRQQNIKLNK